ncbi:MAG: radical SAM family heme chaperone HemW [Bacteroidota bacterium]|nr:radical SAM family heme chaperone HemW [Bacteroidota bacterium]
MAGIYFHIPFCRKRCSYCNFYSTASLTSKEALVGAIRKEILLQRDYLRREHIKTIYFGGGTPSLLSYEEISTIFDDLHKYHTFSENVEITIECNPEDITKFKIDEIKRTPINRISLGVQSFFDEDLNFLKRTHTVKNSLNAIKFLQDKGYKNISIDLIFGIPSLKNENWIYNLETAFYLQIPHISAYSLTVENKTLLYSQIKKGKTKAVDEKKVIEQFEMLMKMMKFNNFIHYEISNFCLDGFMSIHNSNYWKNEKYLGIGPSAHSFDGISRQWNIDNNTKYIESIEQNVIPFSVETLSSIDKYNEYIMVSLRTMWGCDIDYIKHNFGEKFSKYCLNQAKNNIRGGLLINYMNKLSLTDRGKLFADRVASDLFMVK